MRNIGNIGNIGLRFALAFSTLSLTSGAKAQTAAPAPPAAAQSQDSSSLGDYARKLHKDQDTAKPKPKVFDNDNIPRDEKISIVGEQPSATAADANANNGANSNDKASSPATGKDAAAAAPAKPVEDEQAKKQAVWKQWQGKITSQKDSIDLASRELDVLQREYQLRAAEMYADAGNRLRNSTQWDKQEAQYKQQIADKRKALEDAKQKLTDLQEDARKAGVPSTMTE